ncbi:hypothetical protein [Ralstonia sp. 1B3]|uniref:hypothetical protein n=1 Tax=Ralstonia sp. 1B3 TaxID=2997421 RepID=UPI002FCC5C18
MRCALAIGGSAARASALARRPVRPSATNARRNITAAKAKAGAIMARSSWRVAGQACSSWQPQLPWRPERWRGVERRHQHANAAIGREAQRPRHELIAIAVQVEDERLGRIGDDDIDARVHRHRAHEADVATAEEDVRALRVGGVGQRRHLRIAIADLHEQPVARDANGGELQIQSGRRKQLGHLHDDFTAGQLHGGRRYRQQIGQFDMRRAHQRAGVLPAHLDHVGAEHDGLRIAQHQRAAQLDRHPRAAPPHLGTHVERAVVEREAEAAQRRILARPARKHHGVEQRGHALGRDAHRTAHRLQRGDDTSSSHTGSPGARGTMRSAS